MSDPVKLALPDFPTWRAGMRSSPPSAGSIPIDRRCCARSWRKFARGARRFAPTANKTCAQHRPGPERFTTQHAETYSYVRICCFDVAPEDLDDAHANLCKVFTHPTRIRILLALEHGPLCVQELADLLDVRQSTLSQHLVPQRSVELVRSQRKGRT